MDIPTLALLVWLAYAGLGLKLLTKQAGKSKIQEDRRFGPIEYNASIIVGLRGLTPGLKENLVALCNQDFPYPYEVVAACEDKQDPAWLAAVEVARLYPQLQLVEAGEVNPLQRTGKNQNLLAGVEAAGHEVLVFTDADVKHPSDWLAGLVTPLGKQVEGREIKATTSLFYLKGQTFWSRWAAIAVNQVTFSGAHLSGMGPWAAYASGASTAVLRSAFEIGGVASAWRVAFNDDLVMANRLLDADQAIYLVNKTTWPQETLDSWSQLYEKFRRWIVTLHFYSHPTLARKAYRQSALQMQLPVALCLALFLGFGLADWITGLALGGGGLWYAVLARSIVGRAIGEQLGWWVLLAPVVFLFFLIFYIIMLIPRSFTWGGRRHRVGESYRALAKRLVAKN